MAAVTADALRQRQFEEISDPSLQDVLVKASDADDYWFNLLASGTWVLRVAHEGPGPMTVMDIGVGTGVYLAEAKRQYGDNLRAVGLTAVKHFPERAGVEYVYGDIQRSDTWQPPETLRPGSVDAAVSSLTFQHLIDPLAALRNTFSLLRPGGHLFTDKVILPLHPAAAEETARAMGGRLQAAAGQYGCSQTVEPHCSSSAAICNPALSCLEFNGHLRNLSDELWAGLETVVVEEPSPVIAYSLG